MRRFLEELMALGEVYAPVEKAPGSFALPRIGGAGEVAFGCRRTIGSPKKLVLPFQETMFSFSPDGYQSAFLQREQACERPEGAGAGPMLQVVTGGAPTRKRTILFGAHPCDIHAFQFLDLVFGGRYVEPRYFARRHSLAIIGVDCLPDDKCFCTSTGTSFTEKGFDLFLSDLGEDYLVRVGSAFGDRMLRSVSALLRGVSGREVRLYKERSRARKEALSEKVELSDLPSMFELEYESPLWQELGEKCIGCGACSAVCPTCYCYDMLDLLDLDSKGGPRGTRERRWDSCLFKSFAQVAGGHDFRAHRSGRIKHRFYHKQVASVKEFGRPACVGCGRCLEACPAGVNAMEVLRAVQGGRVRV